MFEILTRIYVHGGDENEALANLEEILGPLTSGVSLIEAVDVLEIEIESGSQRILH